MLDLINDEEYPILDWTCADYCLTHFSGLTNASLIGQVLAEFIVNSKTWASRPESQNVFILWAN